MDGGMSPLEEDAVLVVWQLMSFLLSPGCIFREVLAVAIVNVNVRNATEVFTPKFYGK